MSAQEHIFINIKHQICCLIIEPLLAPGTDQAATEEMSDNGSFNNSSFGQSSKLYLFELGRCELLSQNLARPVESRADVAEEHALAHYSLIS